MDKLDYILKRSGNRYFSVKVLLKLRYGGENVWIKFYGKNKKVVFDSGNRLGIRVNVRSIENGKYIGVS